MTRKILITIAVILFSPFLLATNFVCPNTFKTVMTGDTMQQVLAACGLPASRTHVQSDITLPVTQMQWIYTLPATTGFSGYLHAPQMIIVFENDQVVEVSSNSSEALSLFHCYRTDRVTIGNTPSEVIQQCGSPNFINYLQRAHPHPVESAEWIYNFGPYKPEMIFIFQNGILQQIQRGQIGQ